MEKAMSMSGMGCTAEARTLIREIEIARTERQRQISCTSGVRDAQASLNRYNYLEAKERLLGLLRENPRCTAAVQLYDEAERLGREARQSLTIE
jgi:hypothetical protein